MRGSELLGVDFVEGFHGEPNRHEKSHHFLITDVR